MFGFLVSAWLFSLAAGIVTDLRRKNSSKYWIAFGVLFVMMMIIVPKSSDSSKGRVAKKVSNLSTKNSSSHTSQKNLKGTIISIDDGKKIKGTIVDETLYSIVATNLTDSIGGSEFVEAIKPSGCFLIMKVLVRDQSHKTRVIALSQATLTDSSGDRFSTSTEGGTALTMSGDKNAEFLSSQIQPHLRKYIDIVFDVPLDKKAFTLTIPHSVFSGDADGTLLVSL